MRSPKEPRPLKDLVEYKEQLEAKRADLFARWKTALEEHCGNVRQAALATFAESDDEKEIVRAYGYGKYATVTLGLVKYAGDLREKAGQSRKPGRPLGSKNNGKK